MTEQATDVLEPEWVAPVAFADDGSILPERTDNGVRPEDGEQDVDQEVHLPLGGPFGSASSGQMVLAVANRELGTKEDPPGSNRVKYTAWYGLIGAWCAMFVSWVADQAGAAAIIPRHAYCPSGANWFKANGRWGTTPRLGAIVYFTWPGFDRVCHVGIVESIRDDGAIVTIEGNTDEAGGRTGGQVMRRVRRAYITGYGYPDYGRPTPTPPPAPKPAPHPGPAPAPQHDRTQTRATQHAVHVTTDGVWGKDTDAAVIRVRAAVTGHFPLGVRATQQTVGAAVDGIWGPNSRTALKETIAELQRAWGAGADGVWGPKTDAAWRAARDRNFGK